MARSPVQDAHRSGFTLVELLVVVTVIVILIAMLMPAMNRAVYPSHLAICETRLRACQGAGQFYAMDHRRAYPERSVLLGKNEVTPFKIAISAAGQKLDDRPRLSGYFQINKMFDCPLSIAVDFEADSVEDTTVLINYNLWLGWRFRPSETQTLQGLDRLGDELEWGGRSYTVQVSDAHHTYDYAVVNRTNLPVVSSHPDLRGRWVNDPLQHAPNPYGGAEASGASYSYMTRSQWRGEGGATDLNFAMGDGSAVRYSGVVTGRERDSNLALLPQYADVDQGQYKLQRMVAPGY